ncbi:trypsin Inhibitor like cysteine rich domain protein [Oesophagostomum dentatum]|uniref:Trypsin Inhibitor like cysteine rich domain protein n=1 Tax=Oesophagostomum dentatum TaxID=61180 RepID=A0A0B1SVL5_OESDE|nr:trypsin Inhibitor like cysteine rich domain protein [Oesophagostomum dentatum]
MGRPCTLNCLPSRCQCREGFVRENSNCIKPEQCPNRQPSTTPVTQNYADEPITPPALTCADIPTIQILCVEGYHCAIVGGAPTCVPNNLPRGTITPVTCATTLMLCKDGTHCEDRDGKPQCVENIVLRPDTGLFACIGVRCPEGHHCEFYEGAAQCVKNPGPCAAAFCAGGICIEYNGTAGCFNTTCNENEEFKRCASCEPTCRPIVPCLDVCQPPVCQCIAGYVRDEGKCIERSKCKEKENYGSNQ